MGEFRMPSLGADMDAGTLVEWLKQPGDAVRRGDIIAVVETQKGAIEIEIFEDGVLDRQLVGTGTSVPVGTPLATIHSASEVSPPSTPAPAPTVPAPAAPPRVPVASPAPPTPGAGTPPASPAARRLAHERGLSMEGIEGTGPGGAIVSADVERAIAGKGSPPERPALDPAEMRKAIAAAMGRSKREIPHYYLAHSIEMGACLDWLASTNAQREPPDRLMPAVPLLKAAALALKAYPEFNGFYTQGRFRPGAGVHVGVAIAIRGAGLVAPAIHDADSASLDALMAALRDLVLRVRTGRLRGSELFDPTVTVSSLGERGVESLFAVIYPPQVAILGFGTPALRPWVIEGCVQPRPVITATLAADHRVSDGHRGALLLREIERLLQHPQAL